MKKLGADAGFECDEDPATVAVPKTKISETLCIFFLLSLNQRLLNCGVALLFLSLPPVMGDH